MTGMVRHVPVRRPGPRSEEHTSELQSHLNLVCRLLLEKKKKYPSDGPAPAAFTISPTHSSALSSSTFAPYFACQCSFSSSLTTITVAPAGPPHPRVMV